MKIEKLRYKQKINSFEADLNKQLKLNSLFGYFSEIAWEHAKRIGVGFEDFNNLNRFWVLSSMKVLVHKMPHWQDEVELVTWPSGLLRLFFTREFEMYSDKKELLVQASSSWVIIDKNSMRPAIPHDYEFLDKDALEKTDLTGVVKISQCTQPVKLSDVRSEFTDIDIHQHVNNSVYIRWIENCAKMQEKPGSYTFEIQFLKEMKQGQRAVVYSENTDKFEIKNSTNEICARALFRY